jgi:hypothetical protein
VNVATSKLDAAHWARVDRFIASTEPPVRFRLYPVRSKSKGGSRRFFRVYVWADQKTFHRYLREMRGQKDVEKNLIGCHLEHKCWYTKPDGSRGRRKPVCGELHFYRGMFGSETTTHEVTHATFSWMRRTGVDLSLHANHDGLIVHQNEESFAETNGFMMAQLAWQACRLKLWK